jgi:hypothetical protein
MASEHLSQGYIPSTCVNNPNRCPHIQATAKRDLSGRTDVARSWLLSELFCLWFAPLLTLYCVLLSIFKLLLTFLGLGKAGHGSFVVLGLNAYAQVSSSDELIPATPFRRPRLMSHATNSKNEKSSATKESHPSGRSSSIA